MRKIERKKKRENRKKIFFSIAIFKERMEGKEGGGEREKKSDVGERHQLVPSLVSTGVGIEPIIQVYELIV